MIFFTILPVLLPCSDLRSVIRCVSCFLKIFLFRWTTTSVNNLSIQIETNILNWLVYCSTSVNNIIMTNKYCNENLSFLHNSRLHLCSLWKKLIVNDERYQTRRLHAAGFFNRHKTFEAQTWNQNLFYTSSWNRTIKVITKSDWPLGLGGGVIINYSGTVTWEVPFCSCQLFLSCIRGAMNQVSSFGILNKRDQELSLHNV